MTPARRLASVLEVRDVASGWQAAGEAQVVDASAVLPCYFADEADAFSDAIGASIGTIETWVPPLWLLECANAILVARRRKRISGTQCVAFTADLAARPVRLDDAGASAPALVDLAERHGLTVYDAAYLELAVRRSAVLVTRDERLAAAARAAKHPVRWKRPRR